MRIIRNFVSFGFVGAVATLVHYVILIVLVRLEVFGPVAASAVGFGISALLNYSLNYRFTFRSRKAHSDALPKFSLVALSGLVLNTLIMGVLIYSFAWHYLLSQFASTGIVLVWGFALNQAWSFREATPSSKSG